MSEQPLRAQLERILLDARRATKAEAGTLFLREGDELRFVVMQNDVLARRFGAEGVAPRLRTGPLSLETPSLAGYVIRTGTILNIPDAYQIPDSRPYMFHPWWDVRTGYQTRSVLAVPLLRRPGEAIGVLELINARSAEDEPVPFGKAAETAVLALAAEAVEALSHAM